MTEHEYWLHVCPLCGRTEVYTKNSEGRTCKKTIKDQDRGIGVECQGEWVTSRMKPEEDIFGKAGSRSKAIKNKGQYDGSPKASWELGD